MNLPCLSAHADSALDSTDTLNAQRLCEPHMASRARRCPCSQHLTSKQRRRAKQFTPHERLCKWSHPTSGHARVLQTLVGYKHAPAHAARKTRRVTLLRTTSGRKPRCKDFCTTNLVWLMGPSVASTSSTAPSTMPKILQAADESVCYGRGWPQEGAVCFLGRKCRPLQSECHLLGQRECRLPTSGWLISRAVTVCAGFAARVKEACLRLSAWMSHVIQRPEP